MNTKFIMKLALSLSLVISSAFGQTAMTKTTTSAAIGATDNSILVSSATGIVTYSPVTGQRGMLFIDREAMIVTGISGTRISVTRGARGTRGTSTHASGAVVYVGLDTQAYFWGAAGSSPSQDLSGSCTSTQQAILPIINVRTGDEMTCPASGPYSGLWTVTRNALPEAPNFRSQAYPLTTVTTDSTAGALTYTAAQLLGGLILRDPNGAGRSDVTPTATLLLAALPGAVVGTSFDFTIRNTADAAETITVTAGTGATLSGTMTIAQNNQKAFRVVITNVGTPAYTVYSLGTVVF